MLARATKRTPLVGVLSFCLWFCLSALTVRAGELVYVDYVIDGDTVILANQERVRLIGINTPERENRHRGTPAQPFSQEARRALVEMVEKRRVQLDVGEPPRDRHGRMLGYLTLPDGRDVQRELLRRGYAMAIAVPPNIHRLRDYAADEAEARRAGRGIWADADFMLWRAGVGGADGAGNARMPGDGFRRIRGRVTSVSQSERRVRFEIGDGLTIMISRRVWRKFWPGVDAAKWRGRKIIARGWVWPHRSKKRMWVGHPFMLRVEE